MQRFSRPAFCRLPFYASLHVSLRVLIVSASICLSAFNAAWAQDVTTKNVTELLALTKNCAKHVGGGPWANDDGTKAYICGDLKNAVYFTADMDIDCDGLPTPGKCDSDPKLDCCYLPETSFQNSKGAYFTSAQDAYFVLPSNFQYADYGIADGQIAAIIYNGKLTYAVFADTGPKEIIGEASYATAVHLSIPPSALDGGTSGPVTYIVFSGAAAKPKIPEDHAEVMQKGEAAAIAFINANGGTTAAKALTGAMPAGFHISKRSVSIDVAGRHAVQVLDTEGDQVMAETGLGAHAYSLARLKPGVYYIRTSTSLSTRTTRTVLF